MTALFGTTGEAIKYLSEHEIAMVDLKVVGIHGRWMHITLPARQFAQRLFEEGVGYDGSSGSGFSTVESGDVAARPDPTSGFLDPFFDRPTLSFICDTIAADTKEPIAGDPRGIARRAVAYLRETGVADEAWMAPEFEFHVFDRVEVVNEAYDTWVRIDSGEVQSQGRSAPIRTRGGYFQVPPTEQLHNLRTEIALTLEELGVPVRYHHHEVGASGQCEIEVELGRLLEMADWTMLVKYVVKNVAVRHGKLATFMPKPVFGEAGNGMHVHQRLTREGHPVFYDRHERNYASLSDTALSYVGGLLKHGRALTGLTNPSTNSFKRLVEGFEAPVHLFFSLANRSAAVRVPKYAVTPDEKRIEYRPPDFSGNIYLTLAALLMAGLDGIRTNPDPGAHHFGPFDVDIARQDEMFRRRITPLPRSLMDALDALLQDHAFLLQGNVFTETFIRNWVSAKRAREGREVDARPHPFEYELYLDV